MLGALLLLLSTLTPPVAPAMTQAARLAEQTCPGLVTQWGVRLLRGNHNPCPSPTAGTRGCRPCAHPGACRLSRRPMGRGAARPLMTPSGFPAFTPNPASGSPCPAEPGTCEGIAATRLHSLRMGLAGERMNEGRQGVGTGALILALACALLMLPLWWQGAARDTICSTTCYPATILPASSGRGLSIPAG